jgi:hypothetical protein
MEIDAQGKALTTIALRKIFRVLAIIKKNFISNSYFHT